MKRFFFKYQDALHFTQKKVFILKGIKLEKVLINLRGWVLRALPRIREKSKLFRHGNLRLFRAVKLCNILNRLSLPICIFKNTKLLYMTIVKKKHFEWMCLREV